MPIIFSYLKYCAILGIFSANAPSLQALPNENNASSQSILTPSEAFSGHNSSSTGSKVPPIVPDIQNSTLKNDTKVHIAFSSSVCCFVVQDTIDVRYWQGYTSYTTVPPTKVISLITFATVYLDTTVTTNVSTVTSTSKGNTSIASTVVPSIPNTCSDSAGLSVTKIGLDGSIATILGTSIASPTQFYVFPSVKVINVPAVSDKDGRLVCTTTSTYRAACQKGPSLLITGINSNAESYFAPGLNIGSAKTPIEFDAVPVSFSQPTVYVPASDPFPTSVINENFGYVPQSLIDWMAQDSGHVSRFPNIASCLPGGPPLDFSPCFCSTPKREVELFVKLKPEPSITTTVSTTVTISSRGCFHPGACSTPPAAPGATPIAAIPTVTPEAERQQKVGPSSAAPVQVNLPAITSTEHQAIGSPPDPLPNSPSPPPPEAANESPSTPTDSLGNSGIGLPEDDHGAKPPPDNPAQNPSNSPGVGAIIASAIGITPDSRPQSQDAQLDPGSPPIASYSISIAPSASAVVINGATSVLPASSPEGAVVVMIPIAVGSLHLSENAASQYEVAGQTITPGAPPVNVQGTEVSLALSATAVIIGGSTVALSSTSTPGFTVGAEIVTANGASQYAVDGKTLVPGGPAITVSGTRLSLAPGATQVAIDDHTIGLGPNIPPPLTLGSQTYTANSAAYDYMIDNQALIPGGPAITLSGTRISLAPSATILVVGTHTQPLAPGALLTIGSETYTPSPFSLPFYTIGSQALIPGSPAITVSPDDTTISLSPDAAFLVLNGTTTSSLLPLPLLTIASQTFTPNAAGLYVVAGSTLTPGASGVVVAASSLLRANAESVFTVGGQTVTANPSAFSVDGTTVGAGGAGVVVGGTPVSLGVGGVLDVGGSRVTLGLATGGGGRIGGGGGGGVLMSGLAVAVYLVVVVAVL